MSVAVAVTQVSWSKKDKYKHLKFVLQYHTGVNVLSYFQSVLFPGLAEHCTELFKDLSHII